MTDTQQNDLRAAARLAAHLLRAVMWGATREVLGEHRYGRRQAELTDNLQNLLAQAETPFSFFAELCGRFGVDPGDVERSGRRGPIEIPVEGAWIRWDRALASTSLDTLRLVIGDCPAFFATFALHPIYADRAGEERARIDHEAEAELFARDWPTGDAAGWTWSPSTGAIYAGRWAAMATTIEPIHHGADTKSGNVSLFRTEPVHDPRTGKIHKHVPLITGGAWRGQARDLWMDDELALRNLSKASVPNHKLHEFYAGGTLEKGADTAGVNLAHRETMRRLFPMWDLLGGVSEGQVMEGRIHVGDMMVVCQENAWRCWDLVKPTDAEGHALSLEAWAPRLKRAEQLLSGARYGTRMAHREIEGSEGSQMIFHDQVLLVGTPILHTVGLYCLGAVTDLHRATLAHGLRIFRERKAKIGAKGSRGMGGVTFADYAPVHGQVTLPTDELYLEYVEKTREEAAEFLCGGGAALPVVAKSTRGRRG